VDCRTRSHPVSPALLEALRPTELEPHPSKTQPRPWGDRSRGLHTSSITTGPRSVRSAVIGSVSRP